MPSLAPAAEVRPDRWDRLGLAFSGACLLHCLLVPVAISLVPLWPALAAAHVWVHPVLALVLVPTTVLAARGGFRRHRRRHVAVLLGAGLAVLLLAAGLGLIFPNVWFEVALPLLGSALLIAGHLRNWQADRCCAEADACPDHLGPAHTHPA